VHCDCEALQLPKISLFPLQTSTPHQLTAATHCHTKHNQMPQSAASHIENLLHIKLLCFAFFPFVFGAK